MHKSKDQTMLKIIFTDHYEQNLNAARLSPPTFIHPQVQSCNQTLTTFPELKILPSHLHYL